MNEELKKELEILAYNAQYGEFTDKHMVVELSDALEFTDRAFQAGMAEQARLDQMTSADNV